MSSGFWYEERHAKTSPSARRILSLIWPHTKPTSVLDVGCGVGTWLSIARELGAAQVQGLEGSDLKPEQLKIKANEFLRSDLTRPPKLTTHYDLGINLEVAEHLPKTSAEEFVKFLTSNCKVVLFSAAPPAQGGEGHINEQWPQYWAELFSKHEFEVVDVLRSIVWNDPQVLTWYKQNLLLFVHKSQAETLRKNLIQANPGSSDWKGNSFIHPEMWHSSRRFRGLVRGMLEIGKGQRY